MGRLLLLESGAIVAGAPYLLPLSCQDPCSHAATVTDDYSNNTTHQHQQYDSDQCKNLNNPAATGIGMQCADFKRLPTGMCEPHRRDG